jgi:dTDP-glucose pyrophosphorylase
MSNRVTEKAVILARGLGTRMRKADNDVALSAGQSAAAESGVKALVPIKRPFLDYVLHTLADAGYREVCLVIGPEHDLVRRYYQEEAKPKRIQISFAIQEKPLGTANAVLAAENFADGQSFLMLNSDNFYPQSACEALRRLTGAGVAVFERNALIRNGNIPADRVLKFAAAEIGRDGNLKRIVEKPDAATLAALGEPLYVSMNLWLFTSAIFGAARSIKLSARGEYEITDAVQYAIDRLHEPFRVITSEAPVLDMSCRADIPSVTERLSDMQVVL